MSIYSCTDDIERILKNGIHQPHTGVRKFLLQIIPQLQWITSKPVRELTTKERSFLNEVLDQLKVIGDYNENKKERLDELIKTINTHSDQLSDSELKTLLGHIAEDLTIVKDGRGAIQNLDQPDHDFKKRRMQPDLLPEVDKQYTALLESRLRIKELKQGTMKERGNSSGDCYGFTMSMADSDLSPYKRIDNKPIEYNERIYKYQKNQSDRISDQHIIKRTRLTMKTFCPSLQEQAEKLYKIASEYPGEDLSVMLQSKGGKHATYLSIQNDQKIRYADSNHGVFLFDNEKQFISAYKLMYQYHNLQMPDAAYTFFSVHQLKEDKEKKLPASNTLAGKWRSLMSEKKYESNTIIPYPDKIILGILCVGGGGVAGVIAGATIGSVVPGIGTVAGAIIGGGSGALMGWNVIKLAHNSGHDGLLGPYHYMRDKLHDLSESVKKQLGFQRECDKTPEPVLPEAGSSSKILRGLYVNCPTPPLCSTEQTITDDAPAVRSSQERTPSGQHVDIIAALDNPVDENKQDSISYSPR